MDHFAQVDDIIYGIQFFGAIRIMVLTAQRHLPSQLLHFSRGVLCSRTLGSSFIASHRILCPGHMPSTQRNMWILLEEWYFRSPRQRQRVLWYISCSIIKTYIFKIGSQNAWLGSARITPIGNSPINKTH
jgi:hypothetical protein